MGVVAWHLDHQHAAADARRQGMEHARAVRVGSATCSMDAEQRGGLLAVCYDDLPVSKGQISAQQGETGAQSLTGRCVALFWHGNEGWNRE